MPYARIYVSYYRDLECDNASLLPTAISSPSLPPTAMSKVKPVKSTMTYIPFNNAITLQVENTTEFRKYVLDVEVMELGNMVSVRPVYCMSP
jgi:hypothetical protein